MLIRLGGVMPNYMKLGEVPRKRHIKLPRENGKSYRGEGIAYEHVVTTAGFNRAYSIMYHLRPPTRVKKIESAGEWNFAKANEQQLRHYHLRSNQLPRAGDPIRGRVPLMMNSDLVCYRCR